ncbi:MAG: type I-E CRISPR-associated protein Cas6/Cse3/CasE [Succinivibrio sp.]|nr:type I-E CRISPR-associated protein Cas6/Cse3/CasE [Succinivibrio sp.]
MGRHYLTRYRFATSALSDLGIADTWGWHCFVCDEFNTTSKDPGQWEKGLLWAQGEKYGQLQISVLSDRPPLMNAAAFDGIAINMSSHSDGFYEQDSYLFTTTVTPFDPKPKGGPDERQWKLLCRFSRRTDIEKWFQAQADSNGFSFNLKRIQIRQIKNEFKDDLGDSFTLYKAVISGKCSVKDHRLFKQAMLSGIGAGKAFGCGLMDLIPTYGYWFG